MSEKILLLFCDGIGLGENDPALNPFARFKSPYLPFYSAEPVPLLPFNGHLIPTRVDMGVPGLPQSATGQTALFCGLNSAKVLGRHISGLPTPTLRKLIDENSIFLKLRQMGKIGTFANALSEEYFQRLGERISATTRALLAGKFPPRMLDDLLHFKAVSHDLTNGFLAKMGYDVPKFTVRQSAEIVVQIMEDVDFCLFEFLLSDRAGHEGNFQAAELVIARLDEFLDTLLQNLNLSETTVILTSDHGNMEDLSVKTHTKNPVPTVVWGAEQQSFLASVETIEHITPAILRAFR